MSISVEEESAVGVLGRLFLLLLLVEDGAWRVE